MNAYLVFRLYGPMASWGVAATGEDRYTDIAPSRSALLGLLGAALGLHRDQQALLLQLQHRIRFAVKQTVPGLLMRDFHTSQVPSTNSKITHPTRYSELAQPTLNTVLSKRDYRADGLWIVAISLTAQNGPSLDNLQQALLTPVYSLSLGRKSCPLAAPLLPQILTPCSLEQALATSFPHLYDQYDEQRLGSQGWTTYFWEGDKNALGDQDNVLTTEPWDEPINRTQWQFKQRVMHQLRRQEPLSPGVL